MFERNENPFISRMVTLKNMTLEGRYAKTACPEELKIMVDEFFEKAINANIELCGICDACWNIERITVVASYLIMNTRNYNPIARKDLISIQKIFKELDILYEQVLKKVSRKRYQENLCQKINCISEIMCKNMVDTYDTLEDHDNWRDGMILQDYEHLFTIIHCINHSWGILRWKGFSLHKFYDFWYDFRERRKNGNELSEEEKFKMFLTILKVKN